MGDNYKRSDTQHISFRMPATIINRLNDLATLSGQSKTETLKTLINEAYKAKSGEIKIFRENQKSLIIEEKGR